MTLEGGFEGGNSLASEGAGVYIRSPRREPAEGTEIEQEGRVHAPPQGQSATEHAPTGAVPPGEWQSSPGIGGGGGLGRETVGRRGGEVG